MNVFVESDIDLPVMAPNLNQLEAVSPANKAGNIVVPVMLLHGEDDFTVPVTQSRHMEHAMKAAGKPVEAIYLKGGDHYLQNAADRLQVLTALDRFSGYEHDRPLELFPHLTASGKRPENALACCSDEHLYPTGDPMWSDDALASRTHLEAPWGV